LFCGHCTIYEILLFQLSLKKHLIVFGAFDFEVNKGSDQLFLA
jgi:hypothetical protein